jgi:phosphomannomutase
MQHARAEPPATLLGSDVVVEDLLPATDGVRWRCPGARVVIRPSGTEPKLKAYLEVIEPGGSAQRAGELLQQLRSEVTAALGIA